jgi:hypothetical protein
MIVLGPNGRLTPVSTIQIHSALSTLVCQDAVWVLASELQPEQPNKHLVHGVVAVLPLKSFMGKYRCVCVCVLAGCMRYAGSPHIEEQVERREPPNRRSSNGPPTHPSSLCSINSGIVKIIGSSYLNNLHSWSRTTCNVMLRLLRRVGLERRRWALGKGLPQHPNNFSTAPELTISWHPI